MRPPTPPLLVVLPPLVALLVGPPPAWGEEVRVERGPVAVVVGLEPDEPRIGDPLTLRIEVTAESGVELLLPAFGEALSGFRILDFAPRERLDDEGRTVATQTYTLDAPLSGEHAIPPILVEFVDRRPGSRPAPEGEDAYEVLTERIEFTVASVLPDDATRDLLPPLGELPPRGSATSARRWGWGVGIALLLAVPGVVWLLRRARRGVRRRSAYEVARARLRRLLEAPRGTPEEIDVFFVGLSGIVRRYLEDRFELRAPELTTEEFLEAVRGSEVLGGEHQELLGRFLERADLVKFAGNTPRGEEIEDSVAAAERFLEETRQDAPLVEETVPAGGGRDG